MITILDLGINPKLLKHEIIGLLPSGSCSISRFSCYKDTKAQEILERFADISDHDYYIICNAKVFKTLAKVPNAEKYIGYVLPNQYGKGKLVYVPNPTTIFANPTIIREKISTSIDALLADMNGTYSPPGQGIIKSSHYPTTTAAIALALDKLLEMDRPLTIDIEAFSLKHYSCGIATISFAWDKHNGIAFPVDYYGYNPVVRKLLANFFLKFKQTAIYHNASFDVYALVYQLFMDELVDTAGLLHGLDIMLSNFEDTKIISYLATNSCAGNSLSLKDQAQEFAGNYAVDEIKDVRKIPLSTLLEYNLVDSLATWYVYEKHWNTLVQDDQLEIYVNLFKPAIKDIIQMQLTGMPINLRRVREVKLELFDIENAALTAMQNNPLVIELVNLLNLEWVIFKNNTLKKKRVTITDAKEVFNPNSHPQLQKLLYDICDLPVLAYTDSKLPSTDGDTLEKLLNHTKDPHILDFLTNLIKYKDVNKILSTFIPAFMNAVCAEDGQAYLFGSFNLGGTVSGRLSSSKINLQQLPSNSVYGKLIKSCFISTDQWLFVGLDFNALEARIGALLPKDSVKLSVYLQGYDSHSLATFHYFPDKLLEVHEQYNSILDSEKEYYQIIHDSGIIEYLTETEFNSRGYTYENYENDSKCL